MSYTIEYDRKVFKRAAGTLIPAGFGSSEHKTWEDEYFVFTQSGCNNIDPRPRDWHLTAHGWNYSIIATICECAGRTEGGGLQMVNGYTTPENYLKMYRKEVANAEIFSLSAIRKAIGVYGGYICLSNQHNQEPQWVSKQIDELKQWANPYGEYLGYFRYDFSFTDDEHFRAFLSFKWLAEKMNGFYSIQSFYNR